MASKLTKNLKIVSLLPSATELLCYIGGEKFLVGRSHEDNYPLSITHLPVLTGQLIPETWTSAAAVDSMVSESIKQGNSLYTINENLIRKLEPDIILTQHLCNVCAIDLDAVERLAATMNPKPKIISLNPQNLQDILYDITNLGHEIGLHEEAQLARVKLELRIQNAIQFVNQYQSKVSTQTSPYIPKKIAFIEWSDPLYYGGHWTPQLITLAGGIHPLNLPDIPVDNIHPFISIGGAGKSYPSTSADIINLNPDKIIICPCGLNLVHTRREASKMMSNAWFQQLTAVQQQYVYLVDGDAMFNRPGPRLVHALEWLVCIIHDISPSTLSNHSQSQEFTQWLENSYLPYLNGSNSGDTTMTLSDIQENLPIDMNMMNNILKEIQDDIVMCGSNFPYELYHRREEHKKFATSIQDNEDITDSIDISSFDNNNMKKNDIYTFGNTDLPDIEELHRQACLSKQSHYIDPQTGYHVFTEYGHLKRGKCCGNKCRHCPFGHYNVQSTLRNKKDNIISRPTLLRAITKRRYIHSSTMTNSYIQHMKSTTLSSNAKRIKDDTTILVLFWSGGKDSFLALAHIEEQLCIASQTGQQSITLQIPTIASPVDSSLSASSSNTTSLIYQSIIIPNIYNIKLILYTHFDRTTHSLNHQGLPVVDIMDQAKWLGLDLMLIPLPPQTNNMEYYTCIHKGIQLLHQYLINGDITIGDKDLNTSHSITNVTPDNIESTVDHNIILVFGDLHLQDVINWRIQTFSTYHCYFPLNQLSYHTLLSKLWTFQSMNIIDKIVISNWDGHFNYQLPADNATNITTTSSTSTTTTTTSSSIYDKMEPRLSAENQIHTELKQIKSEVVCTLKRSYQCEENWIGKEYTPSLIQTFPLYCDHMGENGEFHTHVIFKT